MNNLSFYGLVIAGFALASVTSCGNKRQAADEGLLTVDVALPVTDSITLYKTYPGYAGANASADVVARVNGQLLSKNYDSGSLVKKGAVLFTIEPTKYSDAVRQAQAALATAESEY